MGFASLIVAVAVGSGLVVAAPSNNTLSVYESYDLISTVASTDCLTALSANVTCYRALHTAIYQTSSWSSNALSLICTDTCTSSLNSWIDSAVTACGETTQYNISGTLQTAISGAEKLLWQQSATCLEDATSGEYCNLLLQQAVANGDNSVVCSDCTLDYLTTVVNTAWGQQIMDPDAVTSQIQSCDAAASHSITYTSTPTASPTPAPTTSDHVRCNVTDPDILTYTVVGNETCLDISAALDVSTPAFRSLNALDTTCSYLAPDQVHCLPPVCAIEQVQVNDTCDSITANFTRSVSTATFQSWNPSINSACSNLNALVGQYLCISPPGTTAIPESFPLRPATTAVAVPTDAVTTSNTDCGHWYKIQDGDTCATVSSTFGISQDDFYFLNPQLGADCSALWLGNSYCVQAVGNIDTYSGYSSTSAYTTLASTIDLNATRTDNRTTTHFFYSFPPAITTTSAYNSTALNLIKDYTLCAQAMAYYNISATTEWTSEMYDDEEWYAEYKRVCLVDPQNLPTSPFNTSIVLSTSDPTGIASPTAAATGGSPTLSSATATKTTTSEIATPTSNVSPNGLCGAANNGYICKGSTFGDCCSSYGYCGSTSTYCGDACDPDYGDCMGSTATETESSAAPSATANISPNGLCGASNSGYTCAGSQFGDCCSEYGYCGSTSEFCSTANCDPEYGTCS